MVLKRIYELIIIENDFMTRDLVKNTLLDIPGLDFNFQLFKSLDKTLSSIKEHDISNYDILILDINLPDSKGIETFLKIKKYFSELPILVLNSKFTENCEAELLNSGAKGYFIKESFNAKQFLQLVRNTLELKEGLPS